MCGSPGRWTYSSAKKSLPIFDTHWLVVSRLMVILARGHGSGKVDKQCNSSDVSCGGTCPNWGSRRPPMSMSSINSLPLLVDGVCGGISSWGLPCSRPSLPTRCWFVWGWCVSILEQRSWRRCMGGLKTGPSRRHRIQPAEGPVLDPRVKETCFKKGQKVDPLEIKSGPSWRAFFFFCCGRYRSEARS